MREEVEDRDGQQSHLCERMTITRRLDELLNLHIQSINQNKASHNLNQTGVGPHIVCPFFILSSLFKVTRRYAEFLSSIYTLINQIDAVHQVCRLLTSSSLSLCLHLTPTVSHLLKAGNPAIVSDTVPGPPGTSASYKWFNIPDK